MDGLPYWGSNTYNEVREIKELPIEKLTVDKINDLLKQRGSSIVVEDIYSLFLALSKLEWLFLIEEDKMYVTWCRDVRFNYRDRYVFIPYYTYDTELVSVYSNSQNKYLDMVDEKVANVRFNFEIKQLMVDNRKDGYRINKLHLYDKNEKKRYCLSLTVENLPYFARGSFSIKDLIDRHSNSVIIVSEGILDDSWKDYIIINNKKSREHRIRTRYGLSLYKGDYKDIKYNDMRLYDVDAFDEKAQYVDELKPLWLKRYEFEAFLYCIFADNVLPKEEEYQKLFKSLGVTRRHITIQGVKPLILKYYYKDNITMRRKSYERFK